MRAWIIIALLTSCWVDYKFRNPETGKVEAKRTYVLRVSDVALEAGIYKH